MESSEQQSCESPENNGAIVESFLEKEDPVLPVNEPTKNTTSPCNPNVKITIFAEIPTQHVKKGIRLLPTQTLASFMAKLQKKKIISSGGSGGGGDGEIFILHVSHSGNGESRRLSMDSDSSQTIWELGIRDQVGATVQCLSVGLVNNIV